MNTADSDRLNDKFLSVVISQNKIHHPAFAFDSLASNKFVVLFFSCYECGDQPFELIRQIIEDVEENSATIKEYFDAKAEEN